MGETNLVENTFLCEGNGAPDLAEGGCHDAAMAAVAEHHAGYFC